MKKIRRKMKYTKTLKLMHMRCGKIRLEPIRKEKGFKKMRMQRKT